ncbi:RTC4 domain-containing protein [Favolaschia claudopus]|uniref:Restriction of telomere capping protein 4 n=1 Tax=Favolaschia claudopus TaxID=2862362 RepID=A0AAW0C6T0_9AGAR
MFLAILISRSILAQRHEFERKILPKAEAEHWLASINWAGLQSRVQGMDVELNNLITNNDIRKDNIFWKALEVDLRQLGSRIVGSISGQLSRFQREQPGYYGELGSVIIHETLYSLFAKTDPSLVEPLTVREFISAVLVPEAAVRLIMQDMSLEREKAEAVLRDSPRSC